MFFDVLLERVEIPFTSEQRCDLNGQVVRASVERVQRREFRRQPRGTQLPNAFGLREILEAPQPEVQERCPNEQLRRYAFPQCVGEEHLTAVPDRHESRDAIHLGTEVVAASLNRIAAMKAHSDPEPADGRKVFLRESTLYGDGGGDGVSGAFERRAERITDRLEDISPVRFDFATHDVVVSLDG
jgi:hypothetical protein